MLGLDVSPKGRPKVLVGGASLKQWSLVEVIRSLGGPGGGIGPHSFLVLCLVLVSLNGQVSSALCQHHDTLWHHRFKVTEPNSPGLILGRCTLQGKAFHLIN